MGFEFTAWPKVSRLFRDIVVTEKIDGTNAAVHIGEDGTVAAQSRTRIITPLDDNFGFAGWVHTNADSLIQVLGPGLHFGEWWGGKIQRGYGVTHRTFSLFNVRKHGDIHEMRQGGDGEYRVPYVEIGGVRVNTVPKLYEGPYSEQAVRDCLNALARYGSVAAPGFMQPEGVCVFHTASGIVQKVTLDKEDRGKWETAYESVAV